MEPHNENQENKPKEELSPPEELQKIEGVDEGRDAEKCKAKVGELEKQCEEYLNGWKRAKADLINYKKEEGARAEMVMKFANESLLRDLISVMDSFDLALSFSGADEGNMKKGLMLIKSQFEGFLKQQGLEPVQVSGERFNPAFHEAIGEIESDESPGTIIEEVSRGWALYGKVIRPARVKVAKNNQ